MQKQSWRPRAIRTTSSTLLFALLSSTIPARADEPAAGITPAAGQIEKLPAGTAIERPGAEIEVIHETRWLLERPAIERAIVQAADLEACKQSVKACEAREAPPAPRGFWSSPAGRVAIGVAGGLVFAGGIYVGHAIK